ncbi:MAG: cation diffusion facilitator family transporter [Candidatus Thermoplasmatota archaeon]|nr:cation diffusion facilitator family transporter [Candidatus Thermoplasmatota archaeon]
MPGVERFREAFRITLIGTAANLFLAVLKILLGIFGRSSVMIADGIHSFSDLVTDLAVIIGMNASTKPRDAGHKYGHGKIETLITILIGSILIGVGLGMLFSSSSLILDWIRGEKLPIPKAFTMVGAFTSIIIKEVLYKYTRRTGVRIGSRALVANAWHHRTDSLSSVAALLGIGGAILLGGQWAVLDPIAAVLVTVLIFYVSIKMIRECMNELIEGSLGEDTEKEIIEMVSSVEGALEPHNLRTRRIGSDIAIDIHIKVDHRLDVGTAHFITEEVENRIMGRFGDTTIINVHLDPDDI